MTRSPALARASSCGQLTDHEVGQEGLGGPGRWRAHSPASCLSYVMKSFRSKSKSRRGSREVTNRFSLFGAPIAC